MQTVGAQWLLVDAPNAATLVALVQAANTLPVMLLAPAGGVLADSFDRRWLLFIVQVYFFIVGIVLAVLTAAGQMPPALLLAFTFALGAGVALQQPSWGATIPELVPRTQLRAASRLDLVNVNLSRALGPALAGLVITYLGGVPVVFALNALSVVFLAIALLFWRRPRPEDEGPRERFVQALRAGGRYVWHEPVVRRIVLRAILFVAPAMALWALLPLVASQRLGLAADGYGALFGAVGVGAILGALILGRVQASLSTNGTLGAGAVAVCRGAGRARFRRQFPCGPGGHGPGRAGLDGRDVDVAGRASARAAGLGSRPRAGDVHGDVHGCECLRRAAVGPDRRPGRPAACDSSRNRGHAGRSRSRLCLARARNRPPRRPTGHLLD